MQIEVQTVTRKEVAYLQVRAGVRYWEDAEVDGVEDVDGTLIPLREGDCWMPSIELETGRILEWPKGVTANIHYKVCDAGRYALMSAEGALVIEKDGYVPDMLSPGGDGFGDYIIMKINGDGLIDGWKADLEYFIRDE